MQKFEEKHRPHNRLTNAELKQILKGTNLKGIRSIGILSCQNPMADGAPKYSLNRNNQATREMSNLLDRIASRDKSVKYEKVTGHFGGGAEDSFIISNVSVTIMKNLSKLNYQLSFIHGDVADGKLVLNYYEAADIQSDYRLKDTEILDDRYVGPREKTNSNYTRIKGTKYSSRFPSFEESGKGSVSNRENTRMSAAEKIQENKVRQAKEVLKRSLFNDQDLWENFPEEITRALQVVIISPNF